MCISGARKVNVEILACHVAHDGYSEKLRNKFVSWELVIIDNYQQRQQEFSEHFVCLVVYGGYYILWCLMEIKCLNHLKYLFEISNSHYITEAA